jgi:hypothetical protein
MWKIIKKYYLATFAGMFAATLIKQFLSKHTGTIYNSLLVAIVAAFLMSLVVGTVFYFQDIKWGPKRRKKLFNKSPFSDLLMNRFVQEDDAVVGVIDGYNVAVLYTWPNGSWAVSISVFFDVDFAERYRGGTENIKERNKAAEKEGCTWDEGVINYLIDYSFKLPSYEKVISKAEMMIGFLKAEGLPAAKFDDTERPKPATGNVERFGAVI